MGIGMFLLLVFITFCVYSLINKGISLYEYKMKHELSMEEGNKQNDIFSQGITDKDYEDIINEIKKN